MMCDRKRKERSRRHEAVARALMPKGHRMRQPAGLIVSNCEKPTGISRDRTKRVSLKPTESPQEPTDTELQGMCSHKRREDGRLTLIVAKSPQDDLAMP